MMVIMHKTTRTLEADLEKRFRVAVRGILRGHIIKLAPTEVGVPDRLVILPRIGMQLVELKTDGGRVSRAQHAWHDRIRSLGTPVTVLYGEDDIDTWVSQRYRKIWGDRP